MILHAIADAVSTAGSGTDVLSFVNAGLAGVVVILFVTGKIRPKSEVDNIIADRDAWRDLVTEKDALLAALNSSVADRMVPALTMSTQALEKAHQANSGRQ